jgi:hypothetical protein
MADLVGAQLYAKVLLTGDRLYSAPMTPGHLIWTGMRGRLPADRSRQSPQEVVARHSPHGTGWHPFSVAVKIWTWRPTKSRHTGRHRGRYLAVFSPDGQHLVADLTGLYLWRLADGESLIDPN